MTLAELNSPVLLRMSDVEPETVRWLWGNRLPRGRLSLLAGVPGLGKSFASIDFAARISTGTPWPDGSPCERGSVLFVASEDDPADTVRPRLDAHDADVDRVHLLRGVRRLHNGKPVEAAFTLEDLEPLERSLESLSDVSLVVIDPIGSHMGRGANSDKDTEVRSVLAPLAALAERMGAAVLLVAHVRKGLTGSPDDAVMGSRAFTGIARSVLHLMADPDDKARRLLLPGKTNLAAPPPGLAYTITGDPARVVWEADPVTMTASDVLASINGHGGRGDDEPANWLRDVLSDGPVPSAEIKERAKADGFGWRSIESAKSRIGAVATREGYANGGRWVWHIPIGRNDAP